MVRVKGGAPNPLEEKFSGQIAAINYARKGGNWER